MHFVPLMYFACLTFWFWQRHRMVDLPVYMSLLFTITSLCGVWMVEGGYLEGGGVLTDGWEPHFGVVPTLLYCGLITLTIVPFSFVRLDKLEQIGNGHRLMMLAFAVFVVVQGLVMYWMAGGFVSDLLHGDLRFIKDSHYAGDISPADIKMLTMPLPIRILYFLSPTTVLGLPLFFYYSCVEKRSVWLALPLLAASVSPILRGILIADRTEIIHYALMMGFCMIFFQRFITRGVRRLLLALGIPIVAVGMVYFMAVSSARFENEEAGTGGSLIEYAGQSYANFCYIYDNHNRNLYYLEREFPVTSYLLGRQYVDTKEERTAREGFFVGVFASHVGSWLIDTGELGAIVISMLFALCCCLVIARHERTSFDIATVLMLFTLGAVPTFGIFYYRYYSIATALAYVAAGGLFLFSKVDFVWHSTSENSETPEIQDT